MKRGYVFIVAALALILAFSGAASAGASQKKEIGVWVNDRKIEFDVPPLIEKGTTYVEFKGLFTALGYSIDYNAEEKFITGTAPGKTISFKVGSSYAFIDGGLLPITAQVIVKEGRTLVPLRFVGEATNMLVDWNAAAQTIKIKSKGANNSSGPSEIDRANIQNFLDQFGKSEYADRLQYFDPDSPIYEMVRDMPEEVSDTKTESKFKLGKIDEWQPGKAVISVNVVTKKISGGFYLDNSANMEFTLTQDADHNWMIYSFEADGYTQYLNAEEVLSKKAAVPETDKKNIEAVIDKQIQAYNDEDVAAFRSTLDPQYPDLEATLEELKQTFELIDPIATIEKTQIVYYTATEAVVHISQTTTDSTGAGFRLDLVAFLGKSESGEWLFTEASEIIDIEKLSALNSKL